MTASPRSQSPRARRSSRNPAHRANANRISRWLLRGTLAAVAAGVIVVIAAIACRQLAPTANTAATHFDAIIVLGYPADADGNPTPEQLSRVTEGVREFERGVAPHLIFTGGAAHNRFTEAEVMERSAIAQGIPASAIVAETQAQDTIQNACYSARIMKARNWHSAEVISSASHLPRAGYIFNRLPIEWVAHAAPPLEPPTAAYLRAVATVETIKTARYLLWTRWVQTCEP